MAGAREFQEQARNAAFYELCRAIRFMVGCRGLGIGAACGRAAGSDLESLRRCKKINIAFRSAKVRAFAERKATMPATCFFTQTNPSAPLRVAPFLRNHQYILHAAGLHTSPNRERGMRNIAPRLRFGLV